MTEVKGSPEKDAKHAAEGPGTAPSAHSVTPPKPIGGPGYPELPEGMRAQAVDPQPVSVQYGEYGNSLQYTLSDVLLNEQAKAAGEKPPKDVPQEAIDQAKKLGLIPVGVGEAAGGKVLRPDEAPGDLSHLTSRVQAPISPTQAVSKYGPGEKLIFPAHVHLTTDDRTRISYPPGTHEVPARFVNHPYLAASGVHRHKETPAREPIPIQEGKERTAQRKQP